MITSRLPRQLAEPFVVSGKVACKVMLDLTAYLKGPSESELDYLFDLYGHTCPRDRLLRYKISEFEYWPMVANPVLTKSGRLASALVKYPHLEPVRQRIREGRAFEIKFWDGREIDDQQGSWSFNCQRIHLRSSGLHAFVRVLFPLEFGYEMLRNLACSVAESVELYSGHGGLTFVYNPWLKAPAFNHIYAQARRFWGIDVEDLNATLPLMKNAIKGISWITILGERLKSDCGTAVNVGRSCTSIPSVVVDHHKHSCVITVGSQPVVGDRNRPDGTLDAYYAVACELKPWFLKNHPDFYGELFVNNGNTLGWIRRFVDPDGWC